MADQQQQQTHLTEREQFVINRKKRVSATIMAKFQEELWSERLRKIAKGDDSRVVKHLNSFLFYLSNDTGAGKPKKFIVEASISSLCNCFIEAFQLGIEIGGGRDLCSIVVYNGTADLEISYKGFMYALNRHYKNVYVQTEIVYSGDAFTCNTTDRSATFKYTPKDVFKRSWEAVVGAFCYFSYTLDNGDPVSRLVIADKAMISTIRSKAKQDYVWKEFWDQMILKSVYKRAAKNFFAAIDFNDDIPDHIAIDNRQYELENNGTGGDRMQRLLQQQQELIQDEKAESESAESDRDDGEQPEVINSQSPTDDGGQGDTEQRDTESEAVTEPDAPVYDDIDNAEFEDTATGDNEKVAEDKAGDNTNKGKASPPPDSGEKESVETNVDPALPDGDITVVSDSKGREIKNWDGETLSISGKIVTNDYPTSVAAAAYLKKVIGSRNHKSSRLRIIEENAPLMGALIKQGHGDMVNSLHKLASEGK